MVRFLMHSRLRWSVFSVLLCISLPYTNAQDVDSKIAGKVGAGSESQCTSCESMIGISELQYRVAVRYRNREGTLVMHIAPRSHVRLDRNGVIAFGCRLRSDFAAETDVFVRVFDNESSAKKYVDPSAQHKPADWQTYAKSFKAFYSWNPKTHRNCVVWDFDPLLPAGQLKANSHADFCLPQSAKANSAPD